MEDSNNSNQTPANILDTIIGSKNQLSLSSFEPLKLLDNLLGLLKERDQQIIKRRFGLGGQEIETLESIGKTFNLTRERVRQVEKDSIIALRRKKITELDQALQLIADMIAEHGNIMSEDSLILTMLSAKSDKTEQQAIEFLLNLGDQFQYSKDSADFYSAWYIVGFEKSKLLNVTDQFISLLKQTDKVTTKEMLFDQFKKTDYYKQHQSEMTDKVLKNYLNISKHIQQNPFGEIGLKDWADIRPHDVGDKAYLVLKHNGKPEHYSAITKLINDSKFDSRIAYQETVHNELIKDDRFVLIGRGIYALSEWGYKRGVVADVIKEVLAEAGHSLSREEIINAVLKKRQVKRNTILVGLSNRKNFLKIGKDKYALPET